MELDFIKTSKMPSHLLNLIIRAFKFMIITNNFCRYQYELHTDISIVCFFIIALINGFRVIAMTKHNVDIAGLDYFYCGKCQQWICTKEEYKKVSSKIPKEKNIEYLAWLKKLEKTMKHCR